MDLSRMVRAPTSDGPQRTTPAVVQKGRDTGEKLNYLRKFCYKT